MSYGKPQQEKPLPDQGVKGLILRGGYSRRMGRDKALIEFHGVPQQEYLQQLFLELGIKPYISLQENQLNLIPPGSSYILDLEEGKGPLMGIYSALKHFGVDALLVLPCDMPMIDKGLLQFLLASREIDKEGTFFFHEQRQSLAPFPGIWERASLSRIEDALKEEKYALMRLIEKMDIALIHDQDPRSFININQPEDLFNWEQNHRKS